MNDPEHTRRFERERAANAVRPLERFRSTVERCASVTVNMNPAKTLGLASRRRMISTWEFVLEQAGNDRAAASARYGQIQGALAPRRIAFDEAFVDGERFVYGALSYETDGVPEPYGAFCIVLRSDRIEQGSRAAVFPSDSLDRYCNPGPSVDTARASDEVASYAARACVAALERAALIDDDDSKWPEILCARGRYVEIILCPGHPTDAIDEVRIASGEYDAALSPPVATAMDKARLTLLAATKKAIEAIEGGKLGAARLRKVP